MDYRNFNEDFSLAGKTAIVTGAASGIGFEIAKMYARKGANVVSFDLSEPAELPAYMKSQGVGYMAYAGDITKTEAIEECVGRTVEMFGSLDILVNCAGIGVVEGVLEHDEALVKDTSLAFVVAVPEMFTTAKQIAAAQTSMTAFVAAGIFYYVFNLIVAVVMEAIENKMSYYR